MTENHGWGEAIGKFAAENDCIELGGDGVTVTLLSPILVEGTETPTITLREPTADDMEKVEKIMGEIAQTNRLIAFCADLAAVDQKRLGVRDLKMAGRVLDLFLDDSPPTGGS